MAIKDLLQRPTELHQYWSPKVGPKEAGPVCGEGCLDARCCHAERIAVRPTHDCVAVATRRRRVAAGVPGDQKSQIRRHKTQNSRAGAVILRELGADQLSRDVVRTLEEEA